eukprot:Awhi_evm1s4028
MYTINKNSNGDFYLNIDLYKGIPTLGFENENLNDKLQEILRKRNLRFLPCDRHRSLSLKSKSVNFTIQPYEWDPELLSQS